jgi:hypothetical protein
MRGERPERQKKELMAVRRFLPFAALVLCLILLPGVGVETSAADKDVIEVVNAGFEELVEGDPVGWNRYVPRSGNQPLGYESSLTTSSDARSGNVSLLIDVDEARRVTGLDRVRQAWNQRFAWDAGEQGAAYTLSFYYKTEGDPKFRIGIERRRYEDPVSRQGAQTHNQYTDFPPAPEWTYGEVQFDWPRHPEVHTTFGVLIQFFTQYGTGGKIWIDDVRLVRTGAEIASGPIDRRPGTFYVSPAGNDQNPGTLEAPWKTLAHVSQQAIAGDTIVFLPGEYQGVLRPVRSGTPEEPITFRALQRRTARIMGRYGAEYALHLSHVEHIRIDGLHIKPQSSLGRWALIQHAKHIRIDDVLMEDATGGMPFHITHSEHIQVRDSVIRGYIGANMVRVGDSSYILFEGNSISRAGHSPFQFYPEGSTSNVVVRGNVFHAAWGRNFEFFGTKNLLFEHNIITNALDSGRSASTNAKFVADRGIFRFNRVFRNWGGAIHLYPFEALWIKHVRLYNNVFDDNYDYGIAGSDSSAQTEDIVFVNNVFSRNDGYGIHRQVEFQSMGLPLKGPEGEAIAKVSFVSNALSGGAADDPGIIEFGAHQVDVDTVQGEAWSRMSTMNQAVFFADNKAVSPRFVHPETYNHALSADSPLIDAGRFLTRTVGAGQGRVVPVEDAAYFYDGFGIEGELGDLIAVGSADQLARVVAVDHVNNTLTLDRDVEWDDGVPVDFPWSGSAPDIGVYEHGAGARPAVQVTASSFIVRPGEEVCLSAVLSGIEDPAEIRWQLGDGTMAYGSEVTHRYSEAYDYPIRVRVTTQTGEIYRGTGYVVVEQPRAPEEPFIHTSFDEDDEQWWWRWKTYRPMPADWSRDIDAASGNGVLRVSDPGGGAMSARIAPAEWDISRDPWIYLRYRIEPDVCIGLYVEAFRNLSSGTRRKWLASTRDGRAARAPYQLIADGEFHTLLLDARLIWDENPDIRMLQRLGIESTSATKTGDTYWIDDFAILPEEALYTTEWQGRLRTRQIGHINIPSLKTTSPVRGPVTIDPLPVLYEDPLRTELPRITRIDIGIDSEPLFTAQDLETIPSFVLDTNKLTDGRHQLAVSFTDTAGRVITHSVPFAVRNRELMKDTFTPPQRISFFDTEMVFDNRLTSAESDGWVYAAEADDPAFRATGGKVKMSDRDEFLQWDALHLRSFEIVVHAQTDDIDRYIQLLAKTTESTVSWAVLPFSVVSAEPADGPWTKYTIKGTVSADIQTVALRLQVSARIAPGTLRIEQVILDRQIQ